MKGSLRNGDIYLWYSVWKNIHMLWKTLTFLGNQTLLKNIMEKLNLSIALLFLCMPTLTLGFRQFTSSSRG